MSDSQFPPSRLNTMIDDVIGGMIDAVIRDYDSSISESLRVNNLLEEAACLLRTNFTAMIDAASTDVRANAEFQDAFHKAIGSLQFEDIVSQIIHQQIEHQKRATTVLLRTQEILGQMKDSSGDEYDQLEELLQNELAAFVGNIPEFDSVRQDDLTEGETELF